MMRHFAALCLPHPVATLPERSARGPVQLVATHPTIGVAAKEDPHSDVVHIHTSSL